MFEEIPEDKQEAYPCPECEKGSVYINQVQEVWECDHCEWWSPVVNTK